MKKFTVIANSTIMDAEMRCRDYYEACEIYDNFKNTGSFHQVYIMDNETGELYKHYDIIPDGNGVRITEWFAI